MTQMQQAENQLRRMILDMEIGPGERLTERWVEGQLGASRTSVRTALFRLEAEGLVTREGRGWIVPPIDLYEIEQLFVYREVLEVAAVRLAAGMAQEAALADIEAPLASIGPDPSPEEAYWFGQEFHIRIARLSGNAFIARGVADAMTRLSRARWLEDDPVHHGWGEHRDVLAALRHGDAERAADVIGRHVRHTRDRLLAALRESRRSLRARGALITAQTPAD